MVIHEHKKGRMQVANFLIFLITVFFVLSCKENKTRKKEDSTSHEINILHSKSGYSYLSIQTFQLKDKSVIPHPIYWINNVIFDNVDSTSFHPKVVPGEFNIKAGAMGWKTSKLESLMLKKGDSISVKFYLKEEKLQNNPYH